TGHRRARGRPLALPGAGPDTGPADTFRLRALVDVGDNLRMADATFTLRPIRPEDYPQVRSIYETGLESGHATYETKAPTWEQFTHAKIMETVFVAVDNDNPDKLLGWVA